MLTRPGLIDWLIVNYLKYSKNSNIVKYYYNLNKLFKYIVKCNLFL